MLSKRYEAVSNVKRVAKVHEGIFQKTLPDSRQIPKFNFFFTLSSAGALSNDELPYSETSYDDHRTAKYLYK